MLHIWHTKTPADVFETLHTNEEGLTNEEVNIRLKNHGYNKFPEGKVDSVFFILLRQFQSPLIYILFIASVVMFAMGEFVDGYIIIAILVFNAVVGAIQEGKAQNTLLALKKFVETKATVLRDGKELIISDTHVVPGDIIILNEGEKIPADARVILSNSLKVSEASMTGESEPVQKIVDVLEGEELPSADQKNMVFKGTNIVFGNGRAVVTETGSQTIVGKIAKQISTIDTEIPLKANIRYLSKLIIIATAGMSIFLFVSGVLLGKSIKEMFTTVVSLSVSVIPEGLPIVVTLILATGVWRMSKRNALVKKLQAVEALGQARIIAVDKTGTITKNELIVQKVFVNGKMFDVSGDGYEPKGEVYLNGDLVDISSEEMVMSGKIAALSSTARVMFSDEENMWHVAGDPTEAAMIVFAQKVGIHKDEIEKENVLLEELPFDYRLKYHATIHRVDNKKYLTVTGAPEVLIGLSNKILHNGEVQDFNIKEKEEMESIFTSMSEEGLRVIAFAELVDPAEELGPDMIQGLTFVGFYGMRDSLRKEVAPAMEKAIAAGVRVVMITGDHKITAQAIAKEAGIYHDGDGVLTGEDIDSLSTKELADKLSNVTVFARVNPSHKLNIIKAFQSRGEIVAMTGDGVNDAPSLVEADLGVAMGVIGTEVAKEAADIILLDDNFESIISAIEEGRSIYKTIKNVILYLFTTSLAGVFAITGALFLGFPLPLLAVQIIWLNFVTDGFLDVALAMDPKEKGLLSGKFEKPKKYLIDTLMVKRMILMATTMSIITLVVFSGYYEENIVKAWTMSLTLLAAFQWFNVWNCRSEYKSIFTTNPFTNKFLVGSTIAIILLQIFAVNNSTMQHFLHTTSLSLNEWMTIIILASSVTLVEETRKFFFRRNHRLINY